MSEKLGSLRSYLGTPSCGLSILCQTNKDFFSPRTTFYQRHSLSKDSTRPYTQKRNSMLGRIDLSSREYDDCADGFRYQNQLKDIESIFTTSRPTNSAKPTHKRNSISEDYSMIDSKVNSFRDPKEFTIPIPKAIQLREKVRNELQMGNYHHLIRSMRKALREDELKVSSGSAINTSAFERLAYNFKHAKNNIQPPKIKFQKQEDGVIQKREVAKNMNLSIAVNT